MMAQTVSAPIALSELNEVELDLLQGCLEGSRKAQKKLYQRYSTAMYTLAYRITGNNDSAHDVLQEAFLDVFKDLGSFKGQSTLGAWIKKIVVRKAGKQYRYDQRFEPYEEEVHDEAISYQEFTSSVLEKSIAALPDGCRTVFTLYEVEGYKHREIAKLLKFSENTSRSQLMHAKKLLRKKLSGETK
jgi:RNA polymerase sigma-70 factor, ECF subfamily